LLGSIAKKHKRILTVLLLIDVAYKSSNALVKSLLEALNYISGIQVTTEEKRIKAINVSFTRQTLKYFMVKNQLTIEFSLKSSYLCPVFGPLFTPYPPL
jgi:hypothetical protein